MRKPVRIIGTTIAAAAIVGATGVAASAHEGYDHRSLAAHGSFDHHGFGGHGSFDRRGFAAHGSFDHHSWGYHSDNPGDPGEDSSSATPSYQPGSFTPSSDPDPSGPTDQHWGGPGALDHQWSPDYAHHGPVFPLGGDRGGDQGTDAQSSTSSDQAPTFDQRKAAVVSALQAADARLTALQDQLTSTASKDPSGLAPKALPYVTQARAHVESLLAQVQSATTDQQLAQILQQAPSAWTPAPTPAT